MSEMLNIFSKRKVKQEVKTKIVADYREKNSLVISEVMGLGIDVDFKELKVGDYVVNDVVIERKTIQDFRSSMVNHRLVNQLEGLLQYENRLLIVEGIEEQELYFDGAGIHPNSIRGFLLSILLKYKVPIVFTKNYQDTAEFIFVLSKRKEKELSLNVARKSLDKKERMQFILESFPSVGPKTARKLLEKFGSLRGVFSASQDELKGVIGKKAEVLGIIDWDY